MLARALLMALAIANSSLSVSMRAWAADSLSAAVPERVAALIRPILDLRQRSIGECGASEKTQKCTTGSSHERQQDREERIWKLVGIPVKLNDDSGGKPNGVPE
jgi:hypothetical protein